jgi:hypothetical protein
MTAAIVLHAPLPAVPRTLRWESALLQWLPYARRLQLEGRSGPQRQASLAGLALALLGAERVAGHPFAPRNFSFPLDRKPTLAAGPPFSLSHSSRCVACCVAPGADCGLDIEDLPPAADAASVDRLRHWTATEALLKAAGRGMRDLGEVRLDPAWVEGAVGADRFRLQPLAGVPGVIGHVASRGALALSMQAVALDSDDVSAALERSFGLAAQVEQAP